MRWLLRVLLDGSLLPNNGGRPGVPLRAQFAGDALKIKFCNAVQDGCSSLLKLFKVVHTSGLWLDLQAASTVADCVDLFCSVYGFLAGTCHRDFQTSRFHMEPSLHTLKHISIRIRETMATGAVRVLNPASALCENSEDFVGRIVRLARRVAARACGQRTLQRYLIKLHMEWQAVP